MIRPGYRLSAGGWMEAFCLETIGLAFSAFALSAAAFKGCEYVDGRAAPSGYASVLCREPYPLSWWIGSLTLRKADDTAVVWPVESSAGGLVVCSWEGRRA